MNSFNSLLIIYTTITKLGEHHGRQSIWIPCTAIFFCTWAQYMIVCMRTAILYTSLTTTKKQTLKEMLIGTVREQGGHIFLSSSTLVRQKCTIFRYSTSRERLFGFIYICLYFFLAYYVQVSTFVIYMIY